MSHLVTSVGSRLSGVHNSHGDGRRLLGLLVSVSLLSGKGVGTGRVTGRIGGRTSAGESSGRVDKVGAAGRGQGVGPSVFTRDLGRLGSSSLEQGSNEGVVDFLGVVHAGVEEPDEEGELEGEVLGNVVEDDSKGGRFEEVEETN